MEVGLQSQSVTGAASVLTTSLDVANTSALSLKSYDVGGVRTTHPRWQDGVIQKSRVGGVDANVLNQKSIQWVASWFSL